MMDYDLAMDIAEKYLEPEGDYPPPTFEQRVALRSIIRRVKTARTALSDIRDNAEDALSALIEDR